MMAQTTTWDIVVVGSANTDYTVRGRQLPKPGETALGDLFQIGQGGKGANQAVAAARLGARVNCACGAALRTDMKFHVRPQPAPASS